MTRERDTLERASFMWGGSISPPRPLRNLDGDGPVGVRVPAAAGCLEVQLLQALGYGADAARADGAVVHRDHGRYLEACAGKEDLVRRVELGPANVALRNGEVELPLGELHHRVAGYALEDVRGNPRGYELALPNEEDVGSTRLGDEACLVEEDGVVLAGLVGRVVREGRVDVGAGALGASRDRVVRHPPPRGDAGLEPGKLDVVAHRHREDRELRLTLEVDTDRLDGLVRQRPYVSVLARGVAAQDL